MGTKSTSLYANEEYLNLLQEKRYEDIFLSCKDYIQQKVNHYLKDFKYYHQFADDFYHEVCIHVYSKALPNPAFLEALRNGVSFRFYLAKVIQNTLNTLLTRERNKKQNVVNYDHLCPIQNAEDEYAEDKSNVFEDTAYQNQTDSQDLLAQVKVKFERFLESFQKAFPKIAPKLTLLLKLQARACIQEFDLEACFPGIHPTDKQQFLEALGENKDYLQKDDKEIYEIIHPYFQYYRKEKGLPSALQRWLNQYINGDKSMMGILDKLTIKDQQQAFRITDKKVFADFLFLFFEENAQKKSPTTQNRASIHENVFVLNPVAKAAWATSVNH